MGYLAISLFAVFSWYFKMICDTDCTIFNGVAVFLRGSVIKLPIPIRQYQINSLLPQLFCPQLTNVFHQLTLPVSDI